MPQSTDIRFSANTVIAPLVLEGFYFCSLSRDLCDHAIDGGSAHSVYACLSRHLRPMRSSIRASLSLSQPLSLRERSASELPAVDHRRLWQSAGKQLSLLYLTRKRLVKQLVALTRVYCPPPAQTITLQTSKTWRKSVSHHRLRASISETTPEEDRRARDGLRKMRCRMTNLITDHRRRDVNMFYTSTQLTLYVSASCCSDNVCLIV